MKSKGPWYKAPLLAPALKLVLLQLGVPFFFLAEAHIFQKYLRATPLARRYQLLLLLFAGVLYMGVQMQHSPQREWSWLGAVCYPNTHYLHITYLITYYHYITALWSCCDWAKANKSRCICQEVFLALLRRAYYTPQALRSDDLLTFVGSKEC